jgi:hypothetical protein
VDGSKRTGRKADVGTDSLAGDDTRDAGLLSNDGVSLYRSNRHWGESAQIRAVWDRVGHLNRHSPRGGLDCDKHLVLFRSAYQLAQNPDSSDASQ